MGRIRQALASEPLDLLAQASSLLAALDPRSADPFERGDSETGPTRDEFVAMLIDRPSLETSALLAAIAGLIPDELPRARIRREIVTRPFSLPVWLLGLNEVRPHRTVALTDPLGDGEDIMVAARLADGSELTALVYVDHNLGSIVKDAFVLDASLDEVLAQLPEAAGEDATVADLDPADARARVADAIERGAITVPRCETDTWPACRALVQWLCAGLPAGGTGYDYREWSDTELAEITERFLASRFGAGFDDADHRGLLESLLWYGSGYAGHPLRVSPTTVEILLADWVPRKIVADAPYLAKLPDLLRAWVRFAHAERGIRPELTDDTLRAVDHYEPEYLDVIGKPRLQGPAALIAAMQAADPDGPWGPADDWDDGDDDYWSPDDVFGPDGPINDTDLAVLVLDSLARSVGGRRVLDTLDTAPLPDEPFDWAAIPGDIRPVVAEVLAQCDRCCGDLLDTEYRTACRRLLARVASGNPDVLRRRSKAANTAAAVTWAVCKGNSRLSAGAGGLTAKRLLTAFGVSGGVSARAASLLEAAGCPRPTGEVEFGTPDLLVAAHRRRMAEVRDAYLAELAE